MDVVISISRYLLPFLALVILAKCLLTLLLGHPQEKIYGYLIDQIDGERYPLNMWETSIGRSKHCDVVIGYETISRSHAVISRRIDGWYIYDLNSKSGILVNGQSADRRAQIKPGDLLTLGNLAFRFAVVNDPVIQVGKKKKNPSPPPVAAAPQNDAPPAPAPRPAQQTMAQNGNYDEQHRPQLHFESKRPSLISESDAPKRSPLFSGDDVYSDSARLRATLRNARTREVFSLTGNRVSIGRSAACDITVSSPTASRRHALLILYEDGWAIDDSGSTHGTYLNGERVTSPQLLFPGDVIRIGSDKLVFQ